MAAQHRHEPGIWMSEAHSPSPAELAERTFAYAREAEVQKNWEEALARWNLARRSFPDHPAGHLGAAVALRELGRTGEAEGLIAEAMARFPDDPAPLIGWAALAHGQGDWAVAAERWTKLRSRFPEAPVGYALGLAALRALGRDEEAVALLRQTAERFSEQLDGQVQAVQGLRECGRLDEAEAVLSAALDRFPDEARLRFEHAVVAAAREDWPAAAERWDLVRTRFPEQPWGFVGGALARREQGRGAEAEALLAEAVERFPGEATPPLEHARSAHLAGNWTEAADRWAALRRSHPDEPAGYVAGGEALFEAGGLDAAEAVLADGMIRFPEAPEPAVQHALLASRRRDWPEAVRRWDAVRQRFPDEVAGYWGGAQALRQFRRFAEAEALVQEAARRLPDRAEPLVEYAWVAQDGGDWPEAVQRWETVRERLPDHVEAHAIAAEALAQAGRLDEAEALAAAACARFPQNPLAFAANARIASLRGDHRAAVARWQEAQSRFPDEAEFAHRLFEARLQLAESEVAAEGGLT